MTYFILADHNSMVNNYINTAMYKTDISDDYI